MTRLSTAVLAAIVVAVLSIPASAQNPAPSTQQQAEAEKAFAMGNTLMEQRKPGEALVHYKQALAILPNDPSILFNAGVAAFGSKGQGNPISTTVPGQPQPTPKPSPQ